MSKHLIIILAVLSVLLVPLIAMQFTTAVNWSIGDFAIAGVLLYGVGSAAHWILGRYRVSPYRWLMVAVIVIVFLLIWAELAVGVFDSPWAGN